MAQEAGWGWGILGVLLLPFPLSTAQSASSYFQALVGLGVVSFAFDVYPHLGDSSLSITS